MRIAGSMPCIQCTCSSHFYYYMYFFQSVHWTSVRFILFFLFILYLSFLFFSFTKMRIKSHRVVVKHAAAECSNEKEGTTESQVWAKERCAQGEDFRSHCMTDIHQNSTLSWYGSDSWMDGYCCINKHFDTFIILLRCGTMTRKWLMVELLISR